MMERIALLVFGIVAVILTIADVAAGYRTTMYFADLAGINVSSLIAAQVIFTVLLFGFLVLMSAFPHTYEE